MLKVKDLLAAVADEVYGNQFSREEAIEKTKSHFTIFSQAKLLGRINKDVTSVMDGLTQLCDIVSMMKDGELKDKMTPELLQRASEVAWQKRQ